MILLRSLLYFAGLVISVVVFGLLIALFGWFLPSSYADTMSNAWGTTNLWLLKWVCGLSYRIKGEEHLPDGGAIIMAKHQSTWETIALRGILPAAQSWILKQELMRIPLFGLGLKFAKSIAIDRSAGRKAAMKVVTEGIERLNEGRNVIIFPEGTRTAPGERKKYSIGGGLLAERSGATVVPIAHNAGIFWRRRDVKKYPGTIDVIVGPPIASEGKKASEIMREVEEWIESTLETLPTEKI